MTDDERPLYYDRQGKPMTMEQWAATFECGVDKREELNRVAQTFVWPCWISTVWLGIDHRCGGKGPPIIFETMIFVSEDPEVHPVIRDMDTECWRYCTEAEALAGHDRVVAAVRNMLADVDTADEVLAEVANRVEGKPDA